MEQDEIFQFDNVCDGWAVRGVVNTVLDSDQPSTIFMKLHRAFYIIESLLSSVENTKFHLRRVLLSLLLKFGLLYLVNNFDQEFLKFVREDNQRERVGGIIIDCTGEYVLLVRPPLNHCWSLPKSKKTPQDSDADAAKREIKEEVGLEVDPRLLTRFVPKIQVNSANQYFTSRMYFCQPLCLNTHFAPELNLEIGYISWFRIDELLSFTPERALTASGFECNEKAWQNLHVFLDEIKAEADEIKARHIDHPGCGSADFCIPVHDVGRLPYQDLVVLHPNQQNQQLA